MMKEEFCARAHIEEDALSADDYEVIEKVYATHPAIDAVSGKDQIAAFYNLPCGMRIIRDMVPTAEKAAQLSQEILRINQEISSLFHERGEKIRQYEALKR